MKRKRRKNGAYAPILLSTKTRRLLRTCVRLPQFFYVSSWVTRIEHEEDDVGLVEGFVQYADVVSALLFLRLVGSCRRRVGRADEMSLASGLCELGNARKDRCRDRRDLFLPISHGRASSKNEQAQAFLPR
jgi:hypothetical protein